jgi:hypothetical protein
MQMHRYCSLTNNRIPKLYQMVPEQICSENAASVAKSLLEIIVSGSVPVVLNNRGLLMNASYVHVLSPTVQHLMKAHAKISTVSLGQPFGTAAAC